VWSERGASVWDLWGLGNSESRGGCCDFAYTSYLKHKINSPHFASPEYELCDRMNHG
jgi:hypothetical protein